MQIVSFRIFFVNSRVHEMIDVSNMKYNHVIVWQW